MNFAETSVLRRLTEATTLVLQGDLRAAEEALSQIEAVDAAPMAELRAATTQLVKRLAESLAAKEEALASVQLSMLELEGIRDDLIVKEARYRELISNMNDGVVVYEAVGQGEDFVITEVNPAVLRIERVAREDLVGRRLTEVFPGAREFGLLEVLRRVHQTGVSEQLSARFYEDQWRTGWRENFVYRLPAGGIVVVYSDVSARKSSELALRESEARFQSLTNSTRDAIILIDPEGRIEFWNPAAEQLFGYQTQEAIGQDAHQLLAPNHYHATHENAYAEFQKTGLGAVVDKTVDLEALRRDGTVIPVEVSLSAFQKGGGWCAAAIIRDITERRKVESVLQQERILLRTVIDHLPDGVYAKDTKSCKTLANPADARILGYTTEAEVLGKTDFELLPRQAAISTFLDDQSVIQNGQPVLNREECFANRLGRKVWLQTSKIPLRNETGTVVGLVGIGHDITERKRVEAERAQMELQLRQAQKLESVGRLAAGIAHEINTPTQYIGDNIHFLQDAFEMLQKTLVALEPLLRAPKNEGIPSSMLAEFQATFDASDLPYLMDEVPKAIQQSLEGVARVSNIVSAMKDFSHPNAAEKTAADLNRAINSTLTVCRNEWKYVADLATDFDPNLPLVPCLLGEFNQVVLNLVVNAAHAIADAVKEGEKGAIHVSTRQDGEWIEIRVSDTGTGIPEKIRSRVFDPFFTTKEVGKGTGQGLAIAHSVITEKHGGTIHFETQLGKGTTFILRLPIAEKKTAPPSVERL